MDAGNLMKPALARGQLQCIGATTVEEYRKHIEKDAALAGRCRLTPGRPQIDPDCPQVDPRLNLG